MGSWHLVAQLLHPSPVKKTGLLNRFFQDVQGPEWKDNAEEAIVVEASVRKPTEDLQVAWHCVPWQLVAGTCPPKDSLQLSMNCHSSVVEWQQ